ncbi:hypothetical protein DSL72_003498 [Monilinia vaccinii-corymbosi]|uniref:AB hydrolase-1 domain-containing protein n=1 Tax=Monilinia vaccinii-corymbosi TaxID=61207 RepID=A0A8A3P801_9HELO|nr:hypothetical protein DSL72_003498 [Monilinia vaccinii-corymbosi]
MDKYSLVLIDLRGYGLSSKPRASKDGGHAEYSKSVMGEDCLAVMTSLGYAQFSILAHDRGARVAHQLAIDHAAAITKIMLVDILPTLTMYERGRYTWYQQYWHWQFLAQPSPFPEAAIGAHPALYAEKFLGPRGRGVLFDAGAREVYEGLLRDREALHAMCEDYRAGASIDLAEQRRDRQAGRKILCDVFVVWGRKGACEAEFGDVLQLWREVCEGRVEGCGVDGGHYVPEECSEELVTLARRFF